MEKKRVEHDFGARLEHFMRLLVVVPDSQLTFNTYGTKELEVIVVGGDCGHIVFEIFQNLLIVAVKIQTES